MRNVEYNFFIKYFIQIQIQFENLLSACVPKIFNETYLKSIFEIKL